MTASRPEGAKGMRELWHVIGCESLVGGICNCSPKDLHEECRAQLQTLRGEWESCCERERARWEDEKTLTQEKTALEAQLAACQERDLKLIADEFERGRLVGI